MGLRERSLKRPVWDDCTTTTNTQQTVAIFHTTPKPHVRTIYPAAFFFLRKACLNKYLWVYCILHVFSFHPFGTNSLFVLLLSTAYLKSSPATWSQLVWLWAKHNDSYSGSAFTVPPWRSFSFISNSSLFFNIWGALLRLQKYAHAIHPVSPPPVTYCNEYRKHMLEYNLLSHAEPLASASFPGWTQVELIDKFSRLRMPHVSLLLLSLSSH